jgi:hypothetical protein
MAFPNQFWFTYSLGPTGASGIKDDLLNFITMVDPFDTPFISSAPKTTITNTWHFWITAALAATATGGAKSGDDFAASALTPRVRLENYCQIFRKDIALEDRLQVVNPVGVPNEYTAQVEWAMRELARNAETRALWPITGGSATGDSSTAPIMKTIADFLTATSTCVTASGVITTALINSMMELNYTNGGNADTMYVSPGVKADFSAQMGTGNTRNIAAADKRFIANVDVYESDFGILAVIPDRWMVQSTSLTASANVFLLERAKARVGFLRPFRHTPIGKGGDATRGYILGDLTIEILHPSAHIRASGLTT